jgi:prevent-host-death family protein
MKVTIRAQDVVPISEARARLTELAEDVVAGAEKVLTKNGSAFVAIVDAKKLDYYHELERHELGRLLMLSDAERGMHDVHAGRTSSAEDFRRSLQDRAEKRRVKSQT